VGADDPGLGSPLGSAFSRLLSRGRLAALALICARPCVRVVDVY
jgi:hypothetical protein